jgi:hypothetical protein
LVRVEQALESKSIEPAVAVNTTEWADEQRSEYPLLRESAPFGAVDIVPMTSRALAIPQPFVERQSSFCFFLDTRHDEIAVRVFYSKKLPVS